MYIQNIYLDKFRLWEPEVDFDLVNCGFDFQSVTCEVGQPGDFIVPSILVQGYNYKPSYIEAINRLDSNLDDTINRTYLLTPMFLIFPFSTSSSSFCQVGYGFSVRSKSIPPSSLNATGLQG